MSTPIPFSVQGAIFDVDDTLLDNKPAVVGQAYHERARLAATHTVGERYNLPALARLSPLDNRRAFIEAPVHTIEAAVWNMLRMTGVAQDIPIDPTDPLLLEIITLKDELYEQILRTEGEALPGAVAFVHSLADAGLTGRLAIASTAIRRDVDIFLAKTGLDDLFPDHRIKTKESIAYPKPDPEVFNLAFASLELPETARANVCAFEDDPRGISAARGAGLYVCAITSRYSAGELRALEVPPHVIADSYADFRTLFRLPQLRSPQPTPA